MGDMEISQEVMDFFENLSNEEPETTETEPVAEGDETEHSEEPALEEQEHSEESIEEPVSEQEELTQQDENEQEEEEPAEVDWEKRFKDLQSQKDREVNAVSEQLAQLQQWAQQQYAWQQQVIAEQQQSQAQAQQEAVIPVTREQVDQQLDMNPVGTFQWIAVNRPDLMPSVISMVREKEKLGNVVADQMMAEWTNYQLAQQQYAFDERLQIQQAEMQAPQQVSATMEQIIGTLEQRHGETFSALKEDIAEKAVEAAEPFKQYMNQNGLEITPQAVADFITQIYLDVREERLNVQAQKPKGPQKLTPQQHVESSGGNRQKDTTPDEDAMNELLQGAMALGIDVTQPASA